MNELIVTLELKYFGDEMPDNRDKIVIDLTRKKHMNDNQIEQEIQVKGLTAPRITPDDIEDNVASEVYFTAYQGAAMATSGPIPGELSLLTLCVIVTKNGFIVTGESACASPENFDAEIGRKIARENAVNKMWPLMGYELKSKLANTLT